MLKLKASVLIPGFFLNTYFMCMGVFACSILLVCVPRVQGAEEAVRFLELELQMVVSCTVGAAGN